MAFVLSKRSLQRLVGVSTTGGGLSVPDPTHAHGIPVTLRGCRHRSPELRRSGRRWTDLPGQFAQSERNQFVFGIGGAWLLRGKMALSLDYDGSLNNDNGYSQSINARVGTKRLTGVVFGAQSFAILPKIREWDELVQSDPQARAVLREVHPEVSFAALNGGRGKGLAFKKKSQDGTAIRTELLSPVFGSEQVARLVQSVVRRQATTDDVLDALVALWSAERVAAGEAVSLPTLPVSDATGLATAIWY